MENLTRNLISEDWESETATDIAGIITIAIALVFALAFTLILALAITAIVTIIVPTYVATLIIIVAVILGMYLASIAVFDKDGSISKKFLFVGAYLHYRKRIKTMVTENDR
jgi:uncharacterized membrane protein